MWILFAIFIASYMALNLEIPYVIDDYPYSRSFVGIDNFNQDTDPSRLVDSLPAFLASIWNHTHAVNGRIFSAVVQQIFCGLLPKCVYDLLLAGFMSLMLVLASGGVRKTGIVAFLLFFLLCCPTVFYEGVSMTSNYVIPSTLFCLILFLLRRWQHCLSGGRLLLLVLLSVASGLAHETLSVPLSATFFCYLVFRRHSLSTGQKVVMTFYIASTALLVFASATLQRFTMVKTGDEVAESVPFIMLFRQFRLLYLYLLMVGVLSLRRGVDFLISNYLPRNAFLLLCLSFSFAFTLLVGPIVNRVVYGTEFIAVLLMVKLFDEVPLLRRNTFTLSILGLVLSTTLLLSISHFERPYITAFQEAEIQVKECRGRECHIVVEPQDTLPKYCQRYIVVTLNEFQLEQFRWKYGKRAVTY